MSADLASADYDAATTERMGGAMMDALAALDLNEAQARLLRDAQMRSIELIQARHDLLDGVNPLQRMSLDVISALMHIKTACQALLDIPATCALAPETITIHPDSDELAVEIRDQIALLNTELTVLVGECMTGDGALPHAIQRAEVAQVWIDNMEDWVSNMRSARNKAIRASMPDHTPGAIARRLGITKTFVLRVRDTPDSAKLDSARDCENRKAAQLRARRLFDR